MENEPRSVKVNCSFSSKEIECPENMLNAEKHSCFECFQELSKKKDIDIRNVHVDLPMDKFNEFVPETMADSMVWEVFPHVWKERKNELKEFSKRAKECLDVLYESESKEILEALADYSITRSY